MPFFGCLICQLVKQFGKSFSILGQIDAVGRGSDNFYSRPLQREGELQGRLAAELNNHPVGIFPLDDVQDLLHGQRLEIKLVRSIVIRADGFRIAVDHDGFITFFFEGEGGVHAAVIELNSLTDAIGAAAQDHDLLSLRRLGLIFPFVGRI